ncbi:hypothetical protein [Acinetobacter johnsonii]|uniref:hypothetical protein n=1 Tax=Acinetobacter johnsonii TaxID=40214 RepID=UPI00191B371F|nr:hypothetical protein [Acinetobacter johnsonii]QQT91937.1 hypothetical protein I6I51_08850 [Acinetobacter johnsonii]
MNKMTKIALATASVLSVGALTACQSTQASKDMEQSQHMQDIKKACDGKAVGSAVQVKAGEQTLEGTCAISFKPNRDEMKRGEHRPMRGDQAGRGEFRGMHMQRGEPLTDAKRAELTQQYDQRLAERQARQQAATKACQGQTDGKAVQLKVGTQTVDGKCIVHFQPKAPVSAPNKAA